MPAPRTTAEILDYHRRAVVALRTLDRAFESLGQKDQEYFPRRRAAFLEVLEDMREELDRHGLAHGRYFNKSGVHHTSPEDVVDVIRELFDTIHNYTADFPRS